MTPFHFLKSVLPPSSKGEYYAICSVSKTEPWNTYYMPSIEEAAELAAYLDKRGYDVYYSIGTLNSKRRIRTNTVLVQELAFDIDVKAKDTCYSSIEDCIAGCHQFCNLMQFPLPFIILSGGGIHCHWVLNRPIDRECYTKLCLGLKHAARTNNFKIDFATVGSSVQVLRVPGTHNYKREVPHLVRPLHDIVLNHIDLSDLQPLFDIGDQLLLTYREKASQQNINPGKIELLAERCGAAQELVADGGVKLHYEAWRGLAANVALCEGGDAWFHEHSSKYPGYEPDRTQQKLDDARLFIEENDGGPVTCARIGDFYPGCKKCEYFNRVKSPVQLSKVDWEQTEVAPEPESEETADLATVWNGSTLIDGTVGLVSSLEAELGGAVRHLVHTAKEDFYVATEDWLSRDAMDKHLASRDLTIMNADAKRWSNYARNEKAKIKGKVTGKMASSMGWSDDFTLFKHGMYQITKGGIKYVPAEPKIEPLVKDIRPMGASTTDLWYENPDWIERGMRGQVDALRPFFEEGFEHQACVILGPGLGGLFWELHERDQGGIIVSTYGEQSGTGKTTAMQAALSLHAPWETLLLQNNSSAVQHQEKLAILQNFPVGVDEAYKHDQGKFIEYVQVFTTGRPKDRLDRSGNSIIRLGHWSTAMIHTSNRSSLSLLEGRPDAVAMGERIIEIRFDRLPCASVDNRIVKTMKEYAGFFTPYLVTQLLRDNMIPEIQKRIQLTVTALNKTGRFTNAQRYKVAHLAVTTVMAQVVNDYKIIPINVKSMMDYYADLIIQSSHTLKTTNAVTATKEYLQANQDRTWMKRLPGHIGTIGTRPPVARFLEQTGRMLIGYAAWAEYMEKVGFNMREVLIELKKEGRLESIYPDKAQLSENNAGCVVEVDCVWFKLDESEVIPYRE